MSDVKEEVLKSYGLYETAAKRALFDAKQMARNLGHPYMGTAHLLVGVLRHEHHGQRATPPIEIDVERVHAKAVRRLGSGVPMPEGHIPYSFGSYKTLIAAATIARVRQDDHICTGHLLLALALPMAPDASVSAAGFLRRKQRSQDPGFYDCAQRLLSDVAGSLDRVREIRAVL